VGVYVRAIARIGVAGRLQLAVGTMTTTDDRGAYRLGLLGPGRYFVHVPSVQTSVPAGMSALGASGVAGETPSDTALDFDPRGRLILGHFPIAPPPVAGQPLAYPPTFFGGADLGQATGIDLHYGEERGGVDVRIAPAPAARVKGVVDRPPDAPSKLTLRLVPAGLEDLGQGAEAATAFVGADGRFAFLDVPAGEYTIDAPASIAEYQLNVPFMQGPAFSPLPGMGGVGTSGNDIAWGPPGAQLSVSTMPVVGTYWVHEHVLVNGHDDVDIVVPLHAGSVLHGRYVVDPPASASGSPPPRFSVRAEAANGSLSLGLPRTVVAQPPGLSRPAAAQPSAPSDEFTIRFVRPGQYFLRAPGTGSWIVKSVEWAGRDYTDVPLDLTNGLDVDGVVVTFTNALPHVAGQVRDAQGAPAASGTVTVFPAAPELWAAGGLNPPRVRSAPILRTGAYSLSGMPAGDYYVVALDAPVAGAWQSPDFFKAAVPFATRVSVAWGQAASVDLKIVTLK
jgi:hypothetical protein